MSNQLESGKQYNLKELFCGDDASKIVIPDLQRDYCWGDKIHGKDKTKIELVTGFCESLFDAGTENELQLGMAYGYESPMNQINLADGQQRITTLFLLVGVLYGKLQKLDSTETSDETDSLKKSVKNILISDFELDEDDKEPRLQYAIRESTLYFLADLVNYYFLGNTCGDIKKMSWYYSEYNNDPSIQSIINAVGSIEKSLKEVQKDEGFNLYRFTRWLISEVHVFYFDMGSRQQGEEMFVVINTTGEPLTPTENLKPILLGNLINSEFNKKWEEREQFFWENRKDNEHEADNGVKEFFKWYIQIKQRKASINLMDYFKEVKKNGNIENELLDIQSFFESVKKLIEYLDDIQIQKQFEFINKGGVTKILGLRELSEQQRVNVVLPLIAFINKNNPDKKDVIRLLRRLRKNYYDNQWADRKQNYIGWELIVKMINESTTIEELLCFEVGSITEYDGKSIWYNDEEKIKDTLKGTDTESVYKAKVEEWEDHKDFMGDISILIDNAKDHSIDSLSDVYTKYEQTIGGIRDKREEQPFCKISNLFRLFRVLSGISTFGHIKRTSGIVGIEFSGSNRGHFINKDFKELLACNVVEEFLLTYIKKKVSEDDLFNNLTPINFVKLWLCLKTFNANNHNQYLSYWDGNGIGITTVSFEGLICWKELMCGYVVRSGFGEKSKIKFAEGNNKCQPHILDTPFAEKDDDNKRIIDELIEEIKRG